MQDYEKLGVFYLGRIQSKNSGKDAPPEPLLYDAKDLMTHAVCVGMTGSGKTGLCVSLLEEAAIDSIPALIIDPKGDLGNLLLNFPELRPEDFLPWIEKTEATRQGLTEEQLAKKTATLWKEGLAAWGQDGSRIQRLRDACDMSIYTPGSTAGLPLAILRSLAAPPEALRQDTDSMRDRIMAAVSGLLALLGVDADPIQSREHILLSTILDKAWKDGRDLEIPDLIREIQSPPFDTIGVFDLESFFGQKDRFGLAMRLNNLLASPGFSAWVEGEPLDIQRLLYTPEGKPRLTILSIAHLSEAERMFFVTILLNEVVAWMRTQPGTSSLRALLYMDEIFGYFPPTANPPSKQPMLTLLKQARAYGIGCVLATQNPVDLDYKGLSNTGTWFIGRLQTERDKARVLDGLEGASGATGAAFDRSAMEATLAGLGNRVFLMNNVHDDGPVLFETRWAMSYLRGPLTRTQIATLMEGRSPVLPATPSAPEIPETPAVPDEAPRPVAPPGVQVCYVQADKDPPPGGKLVYRPALLVSTRLHFVQAAAKLDEWKEQTLLAALPEGAGNPPWDEASLYTGKGPVRSQRAPADASYSELPPSAVRAPNFTRWEKDLKDYLYRSREVVVFKCASLKEYSAPGESEGDFRARLTHLLHEQRDLALEKLRARHAPKVAMLQERIRKAEARVEKERSQYKDQKLQTLVSVGATLMGALLGRRSSVVGHLGRASSSVRRAGKTSREKEDISQAQETLEAQQERLEALEATFQEDLLKVTEAATADQLSIEELRVSPRKADIGIGPATLAWLPYVKQMDGLADRAYPPPDSTRNG
jgi:hypothetical protein